MPDDPRIEVRDARSWSFFMAHNVLIDHYASIIGPFATLVYFAFCRHADQHTKESHPSHAFLAKELKISKATVKRAIATLTEHGLLGCKHRKTKSGDRDTNIYIVLEPWGGFPQNPPTYPSEIDRGVITEEVGSQGTYVGSHRAEGGFPQNQGVGSVGAIEQYSVEQDSKNNTPPTPSQGEPAQSPPEKPLRRGKRIREQPKHDPDGFKRFYEPYPKHTHLQDAIKEWDLQRLTPELRDTIVANVEARARDDPEWLKENGKFAPNPAAYLRNGRWTDEWKPLRRKTVFVE